VQPQQQQAWLGKLVWDQQTQSNRQRAHCFYQRQAASWQAANAPRALANRY
jgi:hypothetical protein